MRKYRGLTKEGKWVYGWYIKFDNKPYIFLNNRKPFLSQFICVVPETVGQQVGLKDKKRTKEYPEGQEIYEGDIIRDATSSGYTKWWDGIVTWHDAGSVGWVAEPLPESKNRGAWGLNYNYDYEIIGNIHQDSRFMEQGNGE